MSTPYVDLQDQYFQNSLWSNNEADLQLDVYFDPQKPNLGEDFGIAGLKPVIRCSLDDRYLLKDDTGRFYVWTADDGNLWRIIQADLTDSMAVDMVMNGIAGGLVVKMFTPPPRPS